MLTGAVVLAVVLFLGLVIPHLYEMTVPFTIFYSLPLVFLGIFFFSSGKVFARWVTAGFDEW
jgi:ABC-type Fe3+-siderophore transport system permease subunit